MHQCKKNITKFLPVDLYHKVRIIQGGIDPYYPKYKQIGHSTFKLAPRQKFRHGPVSAKNMGRIRHETRARSEKSYSHNNENID